MLLPWNAPDLQEKFFDDAGISLSEQYLKNANKKNHVRLTLCIADKTVKSEISSRDAAIYLIRYSDAFNVYGNADTLMKQLKYAIYVLEKNIPDQKYSAILEYAYLRYISFVETQVSVNDAIDLCRVHLSKVKKQKDIYLLGKYCFLMSKLLNVTNCNKAEKLIYHYKGLYFLNKILRDILFEKNTFINNVNLINKMDYDYLAKYDLGIDLYFDVANDIENDILTVLFYTKSYKFKIYDLKNAIKIRQLGFKDHTSRSIEIVIDEACILYLEQKYTEAQSKLMEIIDMFNIEKLLPTISLYHVHQLIGNIAATIGDYKTAVTELKLCLEIGEELQLQGDYSVKVQLGRFLNEIGDVKLSEEYNNSVLSVVEKLDDDSRKYFLGDTLYNLATIQKMNGKPHDAIFTYFKAIDEYNSCKARIEFITLGKARCYRKLSQMCYDFKNFRNAKDFFQQSKREYLISLGKNHPEVVDFLSQESRFDMITNSEK